MLVVQTAACAVCTAAAHRTVAVAAAAATGTPVAVVAAGA